MKRLIVFLVSISLFGYSQSPNYSEDIAPIIYNKCLQCHHTGGIAPLSFETYSNAVSNAGLIQHVTSTGEMPPWPPDTTYSRFAYENILSFDEITKIALLITSSALSFRPFGRSFLISQNSFIESSKPDLNPFRCDPP